MCIRDSFNSFKTVLLIIIPHFFYLMRPKFQKRSTLKLDSRISKSQLSEAKHTEICWTNYPLCKAQRGIPQSGGQHARGKSGSFCPGICANRGEHKILAACSRHNTYLSILIKIIKCNVPDNKCRDRSFVHLALCDAGA